MDFSPGLDFHHACRLATFPATGAAGKQLEDFKDLWLWRSLVGRFNLLSTFPDVVDLPFEPLEKGIRLPFSNQLFDQRDMASLGRVEGIDAGTHALLLWEFADKGFRTIMGVDVGQAGLGAVKARDWVKTGRFPEKPGEIALEKHFAKFQNAANGDTFPIGGTPFTIVGLIEIREGAQVAAANIYMSLDSARLLLGKGPDAMNLIYLRLTNPSLLNQVKSQLTEQIKGVSVSSTDSFLELMGGVSRISDRFSLIASIVGLLGAIMLIMKTMISNLVERSHEIGILKAVGWTRQDVQRQLRREAFVQAIAGGFLGIAAGYVISFSLGFLSISIPDPFRSRGSLTLFRPWQDKPLRQAGLFGFRSRSHGRLQSRPWDCQSSPVT